jgi:hypothetical protein
MKLESSHLSFFARTLVTVGPASSVSVLPWPFLGCLRRSWCCCCCCCEAASTSSCALPGCRCCCTSVAASCGQVIQGYISNRCVDRLQANHPAAAGADLHVLALSSARQQPQRSGPIVAAIRTQAALLQLCLNPVTPPPLLQPPAAAPHSHLLLTYARLLTEAPDSTCSIMHVQQLCRITVSGCQR